MKQELENMNHIFVQDIKNIIEQGRIAAYKAVNNSMIETYWHNRNISTQYFERHLKQPQLSVKELRREIERQKTIFALQQGK